MASQVAGTVQPSAARRCAECHRPNTVEDGERNLAVVDGTGGQRGAEERLRQRGARVVGRREEAVEGERLVEEGRDGQRVGAGVADQVLTGQQPPPKTSDRKSLFDTRRDSDKIFSFAVILPSVIRNIQKQTHASNGHCSYF